MSQSGVKGICKCGSCSSTSLGFRLLSSRRFREHKRQSDSSQSVEPAYTGKPLPQPNTIEGEFRAYQDITLYLDKLAFKPIAPDGLSPMTIVTLLLENHPGNISLLDYETWHKNSTSTLRSVSNHGLDRARSCDDLTLQMASFYSKVISHLTASAHEQLATLDDIPLPFGDKNSHLIENEVMKGRRPHHFTAEKIPPSSITGEADATLEANRFLESVANDLVKDPAISAAAQTSVGAPARSRRNQTARSKHLTEAFMQRKIDARKYRLHKVRDARTNLTIKEWTEKCLKNPFFSNNTVFAPRTRAPHAPVLIDDGYRPTSPCPVDLRFHFDSSYI
jgi:hypothetical protein